MTRDIAPSRVSARTALPSEMIRRPVPVREPTQERPTRTGLGANTAMLSLRDQVSEERGWS
jgi:hypothetical protein